MENVESTNTASIAVDTSDCNATVDELKVAKQILCCGCSQNEY